MKFTYFIKEFLKMTWQKYWSFCFSRWGSLFVGITVGLSIGLFVIKNSQNLKIIKFENDFISVSQDNNKEVFNEGLRIVGNAKDPSSCLVVTDSIWKVMQEELKIHKDVNNAMIIEVVHDKLKENCK